jgi:dCTP deaminase
MTVASYQTLKRLEPIRNMDERTKYGGLSYGLGPCGYDIRCAEGFEIRPGEFKLCSSMEYFHMPNNLVGIVHDKSTWARLGIAVQNTVIEPGWNGYLTLELTNHDCKQRWIDPGSPIAQIIFHLLDEPTQAPYTGKYQNQAAGAQPAILEGIKAQTAACPHTSTYWSAAERKNICEACHREVK